MGQVPGRIQLRCAYCRVGGGWHEVGTDVKMPQQTERYGQTDKAMDGQTDRQTDGQMNNGPTDREVDTHLKADRYNYVYNE